MSTPCAAAGRTNDGSASVAAAPRMDRRGGPLLVGMAASPWVGEGATHSSRGAGATRFGGFDAQGLNQLRLRACRAVRFFASSPALRRWLASRVFRALAA